MLFEPFEVITENLRYFIEEVYNKRRLHSARLVRPQQPRINIFGRLAINSLLYVQGAHSNKGQYSIPFNKSHSWDQLLTVGEGDCFAAAPLERPAEIPSVGECADSDEAAPLFRDDCAPGFRDDLAPC
ncbi:hypothetical protein, partial [Sinorhizobium meliloti]|uniref:hypothetical protein n=1 Tax=Rhizobium meliloti TaxID=382 RepID=UPI003094E60D